MANIIKDYCIPPEGLKQIFGKYKIFIEKSPMGWGLVSHLLRSREQKFKNIDKQKDLVRRKRNSTQASYTKLYDV